MSTLGDEIRAQKTRADTLSADLAQAAKDLRDRTNAVDWVSGSANLCKAVLATAAAGLDSRSDEAATFAADINAHATSVEESEDALENAVDSVIGLPGRAAGAAVNGLKTAGNAIGDALHRPESEGPFDYSYPGDWRG